MFRISHSTVGMGLLALAGLPLGIGCHVLAGLEEREVTGGAGGASSSSSGDVTSTSSSGMASSSSGSGSSSSGMGGAGGGPTYMCGGGPPILEACSTETCMSADVLSNGCHCGGCEKDCGVGVTFGCMKGICAPKPFVRLENVRIHRAATNGGAVYFPTFIENDPRSHIHVVSFEGDLWPQPLTTTPIDGYVHVLDVDCSHVYAASAKQSGLGSDAIWQVPISGGDPKPIPLPDGEAAGEVANIVHNGTHVIWTYSRGIGYWQKGAPMSTRLVLGSGFKPYGLAIAGADLYWSEYNMMTNESQIRHGTISASGIQLDSMLLKYSGRSGHLGVDQDSIYWIGQDATGKYSILWTPRIQFGAAEQVLTPSPDTFTISGPIVVNDDSQYIHFLTEGGGPTRTYRTTKAGSINPKTEEIPTAVVDEYWLLGDKKRLYLVTPKNGNSPEYGQIDWVNR